MFIAVEQNAYRIVTKIICLIFFALCGITLIVSFTVASTHLFAVNKEMKRLTAGLTEIEVYYDYASDDKYKVVTTEEINDIWSSFDKGIYADDFGNVFIITDKFDKLERIYKPEVTKVEVKPTSSDRKIIPKNSESYQRTPDCKCIENKCLREGKMSESDIKEN